MSYARDEWKAGAIIETDGGYGLTIAPDKAVIFTKVTDHPSYTVTAGPIPEEAKAVDASAITDDPGLWFALGALGVAIS